MASLKQGIKQILINKQHRAYENEVKSKNLTYDQWIEAQEGKLKIAPSISVQMHKSQTNDFWVGYIGNYETANDGNISKNDKNADFLQICEADIALISMYEGEIAKIAPTLINEKFKEDENIILIYGDEDRLEKETRTQPWFKPDWSPDRFLSSFYFGGLVAVRGCEFKKAYEYCLEKGFAEGESKLYRVLFEMIRLNGGFTKRVQTGEDDVTSQGLVSQMPVCHIPQVLFHATGEKEDILNAPAAFSEELAKACTPIAYTEECEPKEDSPMVSIIIPSKDNSKVLFQCINSLRKRTTTQYNYEIVVVDNGSNEENRKQIESGLEGIGRYLYQPMTFNFSHMCNMGAKEAKGDILLFLNDDMEIIQSDWLDLMISKAVMPYVGAVGVKLLYPDSTVIQHAGITNLRVGPAHKLQFLKDDEVHYFGMNRGVHNMLAVTGACLMVRRDVFDAAKGFYEGLAVAFNDVDLCYTIYEMGYYNVVRNDVVLYHHESLSRGNDGESKEKQLRLLGEKDVLYERHQKIYGKDPFYHPYLTTDMLESEYSPAYRYQVTMDMPWSKATLDTGEVESAREDKCLVVGMECAMDIYKWQYGVSPSQGTVKVKFDEMGYYFQGYSFVIGADNACYKKRLLLKNTRNNQVFEIPVDNRYRLDIKNNLSDQLNVDLTGFAAKLQKEVLPAGVYQFGMLAADQCSRLKLVNWSNWVLEVEVDE